MSQIKHYMDDLRHVEAIAEGLLIEGKVAKQCDCDDVTAEGGDDLVHIYRMANDRISKGRVKLPRGFTRTDLTDAIKKRYADLPDICHCEYQRLKDD